MESGDDLDICGFEYMFLCIPSPTKRFSRVELPNLLTSPCHLRRCLIRIRKRVRVDVGRNIATTKKWTIIVRYNHILK